MTNNATYDHADFYPRSALERIDCDGLLELADLIEENEDRFVYDYLRLTASGDKKTTSLIDCKSKGTLVGWAESIRDDLRWCESFGGTDIVHHPSKDRGPNAFAKSFSIPDEDAVDLCWRGISPFLIENFIIDDHDSAELFAEAIRSYVAEVRRRLDDPEYA